MFNNDLPLNENISLNPPIKGKELKVCSLNRGFRGNDISTINRTFKTPINSL